MRRAACVAVLMIALSGCVGAGGDQAEAPSLDRAEALLMEAALRAETALTRLSQLEGNPSGGGAVPRIVPAGLLKRIDFEWVGAVEEAVRELAGVAGYGFEMAGARPARPVMVEVRSKDRPVIMILRDVGLQAGSVAALTVDAERALVVLDWTGGGK